MESEVKNEAVHYIEEALGKDILIRSEGAVIFPGEKYGLETRVFLNSQGLPTYDGKELGLAIGSLLILARLIYAFIM